MTSHALAQEIAQLALTKKASDVLIMHMKSISDVTDYFVVCSGDSDTQVKAIADAIDTGMYLKGTRVWKSEGYQNLQWILLDYVDVVVHIFQKQVRGYYNLERLWGDARIQHVIDEPPATKASSAKSAPRKSGIKPKTQK